MQARPNILIFFPDAMASHLVNHPQSITPNFDTLSKRGLSFVNAHTPNPTCSPARASLMTALLPHNHGVLQVEHAVDDDQSVLRNVPHWAEHLRDSGYHTGYFGKWHIERTNKLENFGWVVNGCDEEAAVKNIGDGNVNQGNLLGENSFQHYESGPEGYNDLLHYGVTDVPLEERRIGRTVKNAEDFLEEALIKTDPWACMISFTEPNTPVICGKEAFDKYDIDSLKLPENFNDKLDGGPSIYRRNQSVYKDTSERQWKELRACYFALMTELDQLFGRVVKKLEDAGELDNTIIIVSTDHGRYLGAHGLDAHNFGAYEEIYNIPVIMAGPQIRVNEKSNALIGLQDIGPTLLNLSNAKPLPNVDGKSFAHVLKSEKNHDFNLGYSEYHGCRFTLTQRVLWEGSWKFVFNAFSDDELYNLSDDPNEFKNLIKEEEHQDLIKDLTAKVWKKVKETKDRALMGTHYSPFRIFPVGPSI
ncbi:MAG: hypothetical protein COA79_07150 [Planctomycetota bacterium]|nr:MAG: hypothetical protein COA79_07150 [Planctomycetota bacterium]